MWRAPQALLHRHGVRGGRLPGAPHRRRTHGAGRGSHIRRLHLRVPRQGAPVPDDRGRAWQCNRPRRPEAAAHPAAAPGGDPRARLRHCKGPRQDPAGHHQYLGHDLLRLTRAARVGWRESVRRLLVPRRDALRDGGRAPACTPSTRRTAAASSTPSRRTNGESRCPTRARRPWRPSSTSCSRTSPNAAIRRRPPFGRISTRSSRTGCRRPYRNTKRRRPSRSIGLRCRCRHSRRPIWCRRRIRYRSPA